MKTQIADLFDPPRYYNITFRAEGLGVYRLGLAESEWSDLGASAAKADVQRLITL
ncbi:MAG: hypothetical protein ACK5ZD_14540 [Hyphomonadaceae bacterium]